MMAEEPLYEADPNCKQCKGTGSVLFDSEAGREYDDCTCLKQINDVKKGVNTNMQLYLGTRFDLYD
jgi:hypothetical protein